MTADDPREPIRQAIFQAAREAAEAPLTAEEDGEIFFAFVASTALDLLARAGRFPTEGAVRALIGEITGYREALSAYEAEG